jgi:ATP-dependent DNA helicase RecQ
VLLLKYFGEEQKHHCGQCDVCLEKKKKGLSPKKIDVVKEKIINRLKGSPVKPDQLIDEMRGHYDASADVVQWMLDEGEIKYNTSRLLILPPKDSDHKKSE